MISAVVLTKNEEKQIVDCLDSLSWCDEIIVIDDNSTDKTVDLAKKEKVTVHSRSVDGDFAAQRNFGLERAKGEWVLFVDADERVSEDLQREIQNITTSTPYDGFRIKRVDIVWGRPLLHGETGNVYFLRLGRLGKGKWEGDVHETWKVGNTGELRNEILHYPFEFYSEFLTKINSYTTIRAQELFKQGVKSGFVSVVLYTKLKFYYNYFFKLGILDGIPGLIHAVTMSFHSFLVRGKLWLLWNKK